MKFEQQTEDVINDIVAPHAGAWIEMALFLLIAVFSVVAPHAGAWIEILRCLVNPVLLTSLPMRERGLKCSYAEKRIGKKQSLPMRERGLKFMPQEDGRENGAVAPHAGAWIEMVTSCGV